MLVSPVRITAPPRLSCHQDSSWPPTLYLYPPYRYTSWTGTALGALHNTVRCGHDLKPVGWKWLKFWVLQLISVVLRFPLLPAFCPFTGGKRNFVFCLSMVARCLCLSSGRGSRLGFFTAWHLGLTQTGLLGQAVQVFRHLSSKAACQKAILRISKGLSCHKVGAPGNKPLKVPRHFSDFPYAVRSRSALIP